MIASAEFDRGSTAVGLRVRSTLVRRWKSNAWFAVIVAVVASVVLALVAGAARTASAPDRFADARRTDADATLLQEAGFPLAGEIVSLGSVDRVESMTFLMAGLTTVSSETSVEGLVFAGSPGAFDGDLVEGSFVDDSDPHQFVATRSFVDAGALEIGDELTFVSLTQQQADRYGFDVSDPEGPTFDATLVGVLEGVQDGDPARPLEPIAVFPQTLIDGVDIGLKSSVMTIALAPTATLADLRSDLDTLDSGEVFAVEAVQLVSESVRSAVAAQASALWMLAAVAAVASIAVLGQVASRRSRLSESERTSLHSIGFTRRQVIAESVIGAAVPIVIGVAVGIVGAVALSGVFPIGFARPIEPDPGLRIDVLVLLGAATVLASTIVLFVWIALAIPQRRRSSVREQPVGERLALASPSPAMATGVRFAYVRTGSGSVVGPLIAMIVATAGIVAAIAVGASIDSLIHDPPDQGRYFDAVFGDAGETEPSEELRAAIDANADVQGVSVLAPGSARAGDTTLGLVGFERVRGAEVILAQEGRLPTTTDEIALGRLAARDLGVKVGDELLLEGATGAVTFRVTGLVVMPSVGGNDGVGEDGLVTLRGLTRLDEATAGVAIGLNLRTDAPPGALDGLAESLGVEAPERTAPPEPVLNLERVRFVPYVVAVLLALLGALTISHTLFASVRQRRRDLAVLVALGAELSWTRRVVHWQATVLAIAPVLVGVPVGLIIGRRVFTWLTRSLGVADDPSAPVVILAGLVVALVGLANVTAAIPARRAARLAIADQLRVE